MREKYYFVSAPFEECPSGDRDYIEVLVSGINAQGTVDAEYLTGENCHYDPKVQSLETLCASRNDSADFGRSLVEAKNDPIRRENVKRILDKIEDDSRSKNVAPMLMLQLRPPETGAMFMPEDLDECRRRGIKVSVTCHEYKLNYDGRRYLQAYAQEYFSKADQVIFFNEKDANNACKHASHEALRILEAVGSTEIGHEKIPKQKSDPKQGYNFFHQPFDLRSKTILSRVPPTTRYQEASFDDFQQRPSNIIVFGLLRKGKGFDIALDLADSLHKRQSERTSAAGKVAVPKIKIIISGKPSDYKLVSDILNKQHNFDERMSRLNKEREKVRELVVKDIVNIIKSREYDSIKVEVIEALKQDRKLKLGTEMYTQKLEDAIQKKLKQRAEEMLEGKSSINEAAVIRIKQEYFQNSEQLNRTMIILEEQKFTPEKVENMVNTNQLNNKKFAEDHGYPLEVYFDVPSEKMPEIFSKAKYAVKIDEKGWANNASGHISAVANGCVLYTSWGMDTPDEVLPERIKVRPDGAKLVTDRGKYCGAVILPEHKYSLAEEEHHEPNEKKTHYKTQQPQQPKPHKRFITPDYIIADIERRESNPELNRMAINLAGQMIREQFAPDIVARKLVQDSQALSVAQAHDREMRNLDEVLGIVSPDQSTPADSWRSRNPVSRQRIQDLNEEIRRLDQSLFPPSKDSLETEGRSLTASTRDLIRIRQRSKKEGPKI